VRSAVAARTRSAGAGGVTNPGGIPPSADDMNVDRSGPTLLSSEERQARLWLAPLAQRHAGVGVLGVL